MSLQTPSMTGAAGDCCVEGRRRVTHRAEAARGSFALRVPRGEASRKAGCRKSARPVCMGHIDLMVQDGFYSNRTDFIRTAIRNQLERHADVVKQSTARKSLELG